MDDEQLARYSRHLLLPDIDAAGQEKLLRARVLIIGLGGLGSPAAQYLAASGVGELLLCDDDRVDLSNLQRQILHRSADVGRPKTDSAADTLRAINPHVRLTLLAQRLAGESLRAAVAGATAIIDASDNFATRYALNDACHEMAKPLISGAAIRMHGQVTVFRFSQGRGPCYRCLYPAAGDERENCASAGVLAPLTGIIGAIQATETLKLLVGFGTSLAGRLLRVDARDMTCKETRVRADPACTTCGTLATPPRDD